MTIAAFAPAHPSRLRPLLDWLRHARVALSLRDFEALPEDHLRDIGVERQAIGPAVDRDIGRLSLLDIGWQPPLKPRRR
jgi:hypothetical protein